MIDYAQLYEDTLKQEQRFILPMFSKEDALNIGLTIHRCALEKQQSISLEIDMNSQIVFKISHISATPNNDLWVERKRNMVYVRQMSSLRAFAMLNKDNLGLERDWFLSTKRYVACGGGFPINIEGVGIVGSICLSGVPPMNHYDDHQLIVDALQKNYSV